MKESIAFQILRDDGVWERGEIQVRNNKVHCQDYSLENERIFLALKGGYSEGVGPLLLSCQEALDMGGDLYEGLAFFNGIMADDAKRRGSGEEVPEFVSEGRTSTWVYYLYCSYSPMPFKRTIGAASAVFSAKGWERVLRDHDEDVLSCLLQREDAPKEFIDSFVAHPSAIVLGGLARNPNIKRETMELLSKNKEGYVLSALARNVALDQDVLARLSVCDDDSVRMWIAKNRQTKDHVLWALSRDKNNEVSKEAKLRLGFIEKHKSETAGLYEI